MKKLLLLILIFIHFTMNGSDVESILKRLSFNERFYLNKFFRACIRADHFGFTIFSDKPVSLSSYFIRCRSDELANPYRNKLISRGWHVWKKYQHLLPHENFIFCEERDDFYDESLNFTFKISHIYLVNKSELIKLLRKQEATFAKCLGEGFSPEGFLKLVENTKTLMPHLNNDEALLGLVLGYGLESALQFAELQQKGSYEDGVCEAIISYQPNRCKIQPVVFVGNPQSREVQNIKEHYAEPIEKIWNIYKDKNFLISVIKALCANDASVSIRNF